MEEGASACGFGARSGGKPQTNTRCSCLSCRSAFRQLVEYASPTRAKQAPRLTRQWRSASATFSPSRSSAKPVGGLAQLSNSVAQVLVVGLLARRCDWPGLQT